MRYCEEYAALLDPYVDGELTAEEMAQVRVHLEICPGCRAYVDDALAIRAAFPAAEETRVPEGFAEGVMERIRSDAAAAEERKKRNDRKNIRRRWTGTLAALAACFAVVLLVRGGPHSLKNGGGAVPAGDASAPAAYVAGVPEAQAETGAAYDEEEALAEPMEEPEAAEDAASETGGAQPFAAFVYTGGTDGPSDDTYSNRSNKSARSSDARSPAAASPEISSFDSDSSAAAGGTDGAPAANLYLTQDEAGTLLDAYVPVWEDAGSRCYELRSEEYQALLKGLNRPEEHGESKEETECFLVMVTDASK